MRQVAGGTSIIHKTLDALRPPSVGTTLLLDITGFDGFACLEQSAGNRVMCASVLLDAPSVDELTSRVANSVHNACRSGQLELPGFPDYGPVLAALKGGATETVHKDYKVCSVVNSSQLAVLQVYAQRWLDEELTKEQATRIITDHNAKFNPDGDFLQGEVKTEPTADEAPAKKIKLEDGDTCTEQQSPNWSARDFLLAEATECMQDSAGRWVKFVAAMDMLVLIERKDLPEHLMKCPSVERPVMLKKILLELEDNGEVALKMSHHVFTGTGEQKVLQADKPLCFLLDERKEQEGDEKKGKKKKGKKKQKQDQSPTFKNFGALLNLAKLKGNSKLVIGWRMRPSW
ncbi:unnamed protein product [Durusdinium trenchii]|uniref:Uncharacterized protein n=1 Tax=Durusdinium trenchii TaxID=1381693 RepID=A0ABP0L0F6_9DINO